MVTDFPHKKVTLVHKAKAMNWLKSKKVEMLLEQTVDLDSVSESSGEFKTSAGHAQFLFMTVSGHLPGMFKSKDMFIGWTRKVMGLDLS